MKKFKNYLRLVTICFALCFTLTACGNSDNGSTSGNNDNATSDVADDVGDVVDDAADGVGDVVDDLVGSGGFDNYDDAHDYFLDTMGSYHADANFELRNEDKNLNDYQEGSKGYHFFLYDTSSNESGDEFGEFYVDADSGLIYKKGDDGTLNEYPGGNKGSSDDATNDTNNGNGSETGNDTNGNATDSNNKNVNN